MRRHAKFCEVGPNRCRDMLNFPFSRWRPSAILYFEKLEIFAALLLLLLLILLGLVLLVQQLLLLLLQSHSEAGVSSKLKLLLCRYKLQLC